MSIVKEAFDRQAKVGRRKFLLGREMSVGASEIGQCARKTWYLKHAEIKDEGYVDGWGASRRGITFESKFFVPAMKRQYGDNLLFAGERGQKRLVHDKLSATTDALLINQPRNLLAALMVPDIGPSRCIAIDCKTIDPRINLSEPKHEHVYQVIVQLGMIRLKTEYKPDFGVLVYTNASFYDDVVEFVVKYDHNVFQFAQKRAHKIMVSDSAADLEPEGWIGGGQDCKYCAYARSCMALRGDVPDNEEPATDPQFIAEMVDLGQQERDASKAVEAAELAQKGLQEKIKTRLKERGLRFVKSSGLNITWSAVKGRPSFDMVAIKAAATAAGIDIQKYETTGEPSDRLLVSVLKQDRLVRISKPETRNTKHETRKKETLT